VASAKPDVVSFRLEWLIGFAGIGGIVFFAQLIDDLGIYLGDIDPVESLSEILGRWRRRRFEGGWIERLRRVKLQGFAMERGTLQIDRFTNSLAKLLRPHSRIVWRQVGLRPAASRAWRVRHVY
jgi:hypothetical protein